MAGRRLQELSWAIADPVWQMPLYQGYRKHLKSNLADMRNTGAGGRCVGVGVVAGDNGFTAASPAARQARDG